MTYTHDAVVALNGVNACLGRNATDDAQVLATMAQVHATLALVEEQRTANFITWCGILGQNGTDRDLWLAVKGEIAERLAP